MKGKGPPVSQTPRCHPPLCVSVCVYVMLWNSGSNRCSGATTKETLFYPVKEIHFKASVLLDKLVKLESRSYGLPTIWRQRACFFLLEIQDLSSRSSHTTGAGLPEKTCKCILKADNSFVYLMGRKLYLGFIGRYCEVMSSALLSEWRSLWAGCGCWLWIRTGHSAAGETLFLCGGDRR